MVFADFFATSAFKRSGISRSEARGYCKQGRLWFIAGPSDDLVVAETEQLALSEWRARHGGDESVPISAAQVTELPEPIAKTVRWTGTTANGSFRAILVEVDNAVDAAPPERILAALRGRYEPADMRFIGALRGDDREWALARYGFTEADVAKAQAETRIESRARG